MQSCSSSSSTPPHGNSMVGPPCCSCGGGLYHSTHQTSNCFSMLFTMPNHYNKSFDHEADEMYSFIPSPSSSSPVVDCTLSLGTPSTRHDSSEKRKPSRVSNFCWDIVQSNHTMASPPPPAHKISSGRGIINNSSANCGGDPLVARRCANCDTTSTPLWRNGPRGPKSLCNACGIRFKKEERRATSASTGSTAAAAGAGAVLNNSWVHHSSTQSQKIPYFSPTTGNDQFKFIDEDSDDRTGIPFLSWRLNVTDRPNLVHDLTR